MLWAAADNQNPEVITTLLEAGADDVLLVPSQHPQEL